MESIIEMEPTSSSGLGSHVPEIMGMVPEATYLVCPFGVVDFRELLDYHEPGQLEYLSDRVDFVLGDPPYNGLSSHKDADSNYDVLRLEARQIR